VIYLIEGLLFPADRIPDAIAVRESKAFPLDDILFATRWSP